MAQRYKLRLSDGTVLLVDYDGLSTWLVDSEAKVQPVGSSQWRPLKKFIAQERRAQRRAERERASSREALPLVYPEPKKDEPAPVADPAPPAPEPVDTSAVGVPEGIQSFADDPALPAAASAPGSSTPDEIAPANLPDVIVEDEPPVPTTPASVVSEPSPSDPPVGVPSLPNEPGTEAAVSVPIPPTPDEVAPVSLPPTVEDEGPRVTVGAPRVVSEPFAGDPAAVPMPIEEPAAPVAAAVPVPPTPDEVAPPPPSIGEPVGVQSLAEEPVVTTAEEITPPASPEKSFVSPGDFWPAPDERTGTKPTADDGPPIIPLKPPDDGRVERPRRAARPFRTEDEGEGLADRMLRPGSFGETVFRGLARVGGFFSRVIEPINRLERGLPLLPPERPEPRPPDLAPREASAQPPPTAARSTGIGVLADEVSVSAEDDRRSAPDDSLPVIPLKPIDDATPASRILPKLRKLQTNASGRFKRLVAGIGRLAQPEDRTPSPSPDEPTPRSVTEPTPRVPLAAPPPVTELPTLRLAETREPATVEDVYEGEEELPDGFVNLVQFVVRWTFRLAFIAVLAVVGYVAVQRWETWFPKAGELGNTMFVEVDKQVRSLDLTERQAQAVNAAAGELPHLAPETIRLVMSSSPAGVLDPPEVFGVACDAADRGMGTLTAAEARELATLREELLQALRPSERQRILEYDQARTKEMVFPYEHRLVLTHFARGARAMEPESRSRFQILYGKAVAAGLRLSGELDPPAGG